MNHLADDNTQSSDSTSNNHVDHPIINVDDLEVIIQPQCPPDDDHSGDIREYTGVFEGPEKTLEVCFRRIKATGDAPCVDGKVGLRRLDRADLDKICARARCTILSSISNQYVDAYVLSESSLFIYPYMLVLKTCGTTTLLRCIATLIDLGRKIGLEIDWVGYSRKNFNFPGDQAFPHQSFHQELDYLYSHKKLCARLGGNGYTLGPVTDDHWFVFVADHTIRSNSDIDTDRVLNIMMFDIDEDVAQKFYYDSYGQLEGEDKDEETARISKSMTSESGICDLIPGAIVDPRAFEPCGYSMNAILFHTYYTIHITPESGSSYASFETNQQVTSYRSLINNVVRTFRPQRFVMTLMADDGGVREMHENPFTSTSADARIAVPNKDNLSYKRKSLASIKVEEDCSCMMGNWVLSEEPFGPQAWKPRTDTDVPERTTRRKIALARNLRGFTLWKN
jgi:S-adenosylmethionine decarboxylase